jgi:ubiquinone/menaquinone biosynthesis C-methylase UbiE
MQDFATKQAEVIAAYDRFVHEEDPRDQVAYMASKFQVDYRLMGMIDIKGKRILNIGCAFPVDELYFASKIGEWVGIDLSAETIKMAQTVTQRELSPDLAAKMRYEIQDATKLDFPDNSFDIGLSFSTFDHIPSHEKRQAAINELARVTKPSGYVIVTTPNRRHLLYYARSKNQQAKGMSHYGYEYCFAPEELKSMLETAGLKPLNFVSTFTYRQLNLDLSPAWQQPLLQVGIGLANSLGYFGHRMGYLTRK